MNWPIQKLSDCCISITDGDHQAPPKTSFGIPFVTISNITSTNNLNFDGTLYVTKDYYDKLDDKRKARKGDVLYSVVGSFGLPVYIKNDKPFAFQRHIAILRTNEKLLSKFLYYTMLTKDFYMMADSVAIGAAQRTVTLTALRNMKIKVPNIKTQAKIISVLSSYDDLIENNQKQIKLLEEAAQRLYKEWFVDFRFPGHENTTFVDGLPEGWKKDKAENLFEITIGKTPPRSEPKWFSTDDNDVSWASISDMGASNTFLVDTNEKLVIEAIKKHNVKIVPIGTILVSFKLTVGKVCITTKEMCTNEAIAHFYIRKTNTRFYTYLYLKNFHYETLGNTSSISKAVNSKIIKSMPFIMPNERLLESFSATITPIFNMMENKIFVIKQLSEARNRLLPKLMSGEIEV